MNQHDNRYDYAISNVSGKPDELNVTGVRPAAKTKRFPEFTVALLLVFALLLGGVGGIGGYYFMDRINTVEAPAGNQNDLGGNDNNGSGQNNNEAAGPNSGTQSPLSAAGIQGKNTLTIHDIFAVGDPATVAISTTGTSRNVFGQYSDYASAGSGFVLTADGYIMTNYHVIEGSSVITVMVNDGTKYDATLVGGDAITDIAVLKIDGKNLTPAEMGDSNDVRVGDMVVAIGNPLGELANSLSVGYISAKEREISTDGTARKMIQTDTAASPGNSGGPLFNLYGQVVGVITAKSVGEGVEGISYAIPINQAVSIANELITNGYVTGRPYLGISCTSASQYYNMPAGAYVSLVETDGPADKAGLKQGDIILSFGGTDIKSGTELASLKNEYQVGDSVKLRIYRSGEEMELTLTLGETPKETVQTPTKPEAPAEPEENENQGGSFFPWGNRQFPNG